MGTVHSLKTNFLWMEEIRHLTSMKRCKYIKLGARRISGCHQQVAPAKIS